MLFPPVYDVTRAGNEWIRGAGRGMRTMVGESVQMVFGASLAIRICLSGLEHSYPVE